MKIAPFIAAGLMIAGVGITAPADAAPYRYGGYHRYPVWERGYHHRPYYARGYRGYPGRYYRLGAHRRCFTEWRHHRRITICR